MEIKNKIVTPIYLMIIWSFCNIAKRFIAVNYEVNAIAFSLISLFATSLILIVYGESNKTILKQSIKEKYTWLYSLFEILFSISTMILFTYLSSTKTSLLEQLSAVLAITMNIAIFKRKAHTFDIVGGLLILSGVFHVIGNLENDIIPIISTTTILTSIFIVGRTMTAEYNPINLTFLSIKVRSRITGMIVLISTFSLTCFILLLKLLKGHVTTDNRVLNYIFELLPSFNDFARTETILSAIVFGIVLLSITRFLYFYAAKFSNTENILVVSALAPFTTWILELISCKLNILEPTGITREDLLWGAMITIGALVMTIERVRHIKKHQNKINQFASK